MTYLLLNTLVNSSKTLTTHVKRKNNEHPIRFAKTQIQ